MFDFITLRFVSAKRDGSLFSSMEQLEENVGAFEINFSAELEQELDELRLHYFNPAP